MCSSCKNPIELYRNRIRRKKKGVLEPIARMSNIHSVIRCKHNECKLCASKNILGLLLNQYRGEERPTCFKPTIVPVIALSYLILINIFCNNAHVINIFINNYCSIPIISPNPKPYNLLILYGLNVIKIKN